MGRHNVDETPAKERSRQLTALGLCEGGIGKPLKRVAKSKYEEEDERINFRK